VLSVDPSRPDRRALSPAATALRLGGLVAFPTETVYGLGASARNAEAVARIFAAKGRPADNPLIVHLHAARRLRDVTTLVTPLAWALAERWWPGPLTVVLDADPSLPAVTTGGLATVAVRVPDHPVALALLAAADVPVAAPSANRSGRPSPTTAAHVLADLGDEVDIVVDGGTCRVGVESTVVDARGAVPIVLREGAVTREALGLDPDPGDAPTGNAASPGTRYRHYAPDCAVEVAAAGAGSAVAARRALEGRRVGLLGPDPAPEGVVGLARTPDAAALARALYDALRAAETAGLDLVVIEAVAEVGLGRAVMDRVHRAAG
jgi:L-threonylcarbamoyladenylate synthase